MASRELLWNGKKYSVFSNKLASILPFFLLLFSLQILYAKTIHVGPNHTIKKIKQAIAISVDGDTILIVKGIYKEGNIVMSFNSEGMYRAFTKNGKDIEIKIYKD